MRMPMRSGDAEAGVCVFASLSPLPVAVLPQPPRALGCVLYELAALRRPFEGSSLPALVVGILRWGQRQRAVLGSQPRRTRLGSLLNLLWASARCRLRVLRAKDSSASARSAGGGGTPLDSGPPPNPSPAAPPKTPQGQVPAGAAGLLPRAARPDRRAAEAEPAGPAQRRRGAAPEARQGPPGALRPPRRQVGRGGGPRWGGRRWGSGALLHGGSKAAPRAL
jgi:hypothetical protein